jgi:signal transduction histidine kinase
MSQSLRGSLRLRLTAAFGLIFLFAGTAVLAGSVILVRNSMDYGLSAGFQALYDNGAVQPFETEETTKQIIIASMQANLLFKGGLTVLAVWVVATATGWFIAGRLLGPLNMITATAQRIAGRNLHQRIALDQPPGEVKSLADSFDAMLDRIDDAFAGQGRFIANAAHELKTPIALNRTLVEVAMNRRNSPPEIHQLGDNLLAVNQRHERLIDSLLTLARADDAVTERRPIDLADLARVALAATEASAADRSVTVEQAFGATHVVGDPILLEQLIRNLLDNAIRYNHPHGWVRITISGHPRQAEIVVANTGPPIAVYEVPTLFEPFRRLTDRVGSARGSGLGLSIVRAVAQAHGGDASAVPRQGGGLEVRVALPG